MLFGQRIKKETTGRKKAGLKINPDTRELKKTLSVVQVYSQCRRADYISVRSPQALVLPGSFLPFYNFNTVLKLWQGFVSRFSARPFHLPSSPLAPARRV